MSNSTRIISASQMKTFRAKNSSVMSDLMEKGAGNLMHRDVVKKEFWKAMRDDSKSRQFGERGYTKKSLTKFLGGMLENKSDRLTDRKVKKLADVMDISRGKLFRAAAEVRVEQMKAKNQEKIARVQEHKQEDRAFQNHINEIVSGSAQKARAGFHAQVSSSLNHTENNHASVSSAGEKKVILQNNALTKFMMSNKNIRNFEGMNSFSADHNDHSKGREQASSSEDQTDVEKIKSRLAMIQSVPDNEEADKKTNPDR